MNAVAKIEPRDLTPMGEVQAEIARMGTRLKSVLPSHIDPAKFQRIAITAIQMDPGLLDADRQSLYTALTKAATDGLLPDKREGALTIAKTKQKNGTYLDCVVWMPMVAGIVKKVRQSGEVSKMIAKAVYEKDTFDVLFGDDDRIYHKPYLDGFPGKIVGAYSIVHLKDGSVSRDFLPKWRIDKAKAVAKTKYVWEAWDDEMSIKTVIRHHAKLLPQSTDIEAAFANDDTAQFDVAAAMLTGPQSAPQPLTGAALLEQASDAPEDRPAEPSPPATGDTPHHDAGSAAASNGDHAKARGWTDRYLLAINRSGDREALAKAQLSRAETLDGMRDDYADMVTEIEAAIAARLAVFDQPDDDGVFA